MSPSFALNASSGRKPRSCATTAVAKVHLRCETIQHRRQKKTTEKSYRHLVWSQVAEDNTSQSLLLTAINHVDKIRLILIKRYSWNQVFKSTHNWSLMVILCRRVGLQKSYQLLPLVVSLSLSLSQQDQFLACSSQQWVPAVQTAHTFVIIVCRQAHKNSTYRIAGFLFWQVKM